ncbi:MAG: TlpA family protein disulfide reductase [Planctomycetes bacterium]|nr:TlpA family protein disulfide reductase [Planctomycetota bacterium]MCB9910826.1 TlpA family protein disulfide reductase [Planctomycetota bacterium]MCB9912242.1 TlpA family protein disulfide reductase [Planctomycetota bacterium]
MPHLSEIQKKYANDGVTIIGVSKEDSNNSLEAVRKMTTEKGDTMGYTVAWDKDGATYKSYMTATGQRGIPTSFIIDGKGRLAFIGHPMELDGPLARVVAGTWDPEKDFGAIVKQRELRQAMFSDQNALMKATQDSVQGKGAGAVMEQWRAFVAKFPEGAKQARDLEYRVLVAVGEYDQAAVLGRQLVDEAVQAKDASTLNRLTWDIVDPERQLEKRDLGLALYGATMACNFTDYKEASILDTLARAHFECGGLAMAIELQEKAVANATGRMKKSLEATLAEYKTASEQ